MTRWHNKEEKYVLSTATYVITVSNQQNFIYKLSSENYLFFYQVWNFYEHKKTYQVTSISIRRIYEQMNSIELDF